MKPADVREEDGHLPPSPPQVEARRVLHDLLEHRRGEVLPHRPARRPLLRLLEDDPVEQHREHRPQHGRPGEGVVEDGEGRRLLHLLLARPAVEDGQHDPEEEAGEGRQPRQDGLPAGQHRPGQEGEGEDGQDGREGPLVGQEAPLEEHLRRLGVDLRPRHLHPGARGRHPEVVGVAEGRHPHEDGLAGDDALVEPAVQDVEVRDPRHRRRAEQGRPVGRGPGVVDPGLDVVVRRDPAPGEEDGAGLEGVDGPLAAEVGGRPLEGEGRHGRPPHGHHQGQPAHRPVRVRRRLDVPGRRPGGRQGGERNDGVGEAVRPGSRLGSHLGRVPAHGEHDAGAPLGRRDLRDGRGQLVVSGAAGLAAGLAALAPGGGAAEGVEHEVEDHHPSAGGREVPQDLGVERAGPGEDPPVRPLQLGHRAVVDLHQGHPAGDVALPGAEDRGVRHQLLYLVEGGQEAEQIGEGEDGPHGGREEQTVEQAPASAAGPRRPRLATPPSPRSDVPSSIPRASPTPDFGHRTPDRR